MTAAFRKEFGNHLRWLREDRKLSQAQVARGSGLPVSAVSHFESGRRLPTIINLFRLAKGLGRCPSVLIPRTLPLAVYKEMHEP